MFWLPFAHAGPLGAADLDLAALVSAEFRDLPRQCDTAVHRENERRAEAEEDARLTALLVAADTSPDPEPTYRVILDHPGSPHAGVAAWRLLEILEQRADPEAPSARAFALAVWPEAEPTAPPGTPP